MFSILKTIKTICHCLMGKALDMPGLSTEQQELKALLDLLQKAILTCRNIERNPIGNEWIKLGTKTLHSWLVKISGHVEKMLGWIEKET